MALLRHVDLRPQWNCLSDLWHRDLPLPPFRDYAVPVPAAGVPGPEDTGVLGAFLRDIVRLNEPLRNYRVFAPDETLSNGLGSVFQATPRQWEAQTRAVDE